MVPLVLLTSECKALWDEPEEEPTVSSAGSYVITADWPVSQLQALQLVYPVGSYVPAANASE